MGPVPAIDDLEGCLREPDVGVIVLPPGQSVGPNIDFAGSVHGDE